MSFHNRNTDRRREFKNKRRYWNISNNDKSNFNGPMPSSSQTSGDSDQEDSFYKEYSELQKNIRHPPGLKGKEIGMFYKQRKRELKALQNSHAERIKISEKNETEINNLLKDVKFEDNFVNLSNNYDEINDSQFMRLFLQSISTTFDEKLVNVNVTQYLERDEKLDDDLKTKFIMKTQSNDSKFQELFNFRKQLPAYNCKNNILELLNNNQVILISGETGCGKTTQVPQYILEDAIMKGNGSVCKIICTQPTRISTISVAERVATEMKERVGTGSVGYSIRLEKKYGREKGSILFCTTGVILKQLEGNPTFHGISHIIMDEIHERDIQCDILLTLLKKIIAKRLDLKVILMSATLNAQSFSKYFNDCPGINIPGFTYPVTEYFLEDVLELTQFEFQEPNKNCKPSMKNRKKKKYKKDFDFQRFIEPHVRQLKSEGKYSSKTLNNLQNPNSEKLNYELIVELIKYIVLNKPVGAILVFLPGIFDISGVHKLLNKNSCISHSDIIIPLHSKLPTVNQTLIFERPPPGVRKIILATNIAETSITIDDVIYVINPGKIKLKTYNVENDIETLQADFVSLANANQRRGRAGRVQAGHCYHLYSKARHMSLLSYQLPEILRTRLDEVILQLKFLQVGEVTPFLSLFMDTPNPKSIEISLDLLKRLNALDDDENLTPLGYHLAKLPTDPRSGKMILFGAMFSCLDPILSIAASLAYRDAFDLPYENEKLFMERKNELSNGSYSDHLLLAEAFRGWEQCAPDQQRQYCYHYFLNKRTLILLRDMKREFAEMLHEMKFLPSSNPKDTRFNYNSYDDSLLRAIICAALYPNVAKIGSCKIVRTRTKLKVRTHEDGKVCLFPSSINTIQGSFPSPYLVYHVKLKSTSIFLHDTTMVHPFALLLFCDKIQVIHVQNQEILKISDIMLFKCTDGVKNIIFNIRNKFNSFLKHKVAHPGFIDWNELGNSDVLILRAIQELITIEENGSLED